MGTPIEVVPSSGVNWGFNATDLFNNTQNVVSSLAGFILLGLAVAFAPKILSVIKGVIGRLRTR